MFCLPQAYRTHFVVTFSVKLYLFKLSDISSGICVQKDSSSNEHEHVTYEPRHEKPCFALCEQQRRRSACASAQPDQRLCCSLPG